MKKITRHFSKKKIDDVKLRRLWVSRMPEAELALLFGCHRWTLRRRALKLGLPSHRREIWKAAP